MSEQLTPAVQQELLAQNNLILRAICHDAANALSVIMMASQQLKTMLVKDPERAQKLLERIETATEMQRLLISKTKDLGWFLKGMDLPKRMPVDLHQSIAKAMLLHTPAAEKKNIKLNFIGPTEDEGPFLVLGERSILTHFILSPLIENAIKFTPTNGRVTITFQEEEKTTKIMVLDNGVGIEDTMTPFLFDIEKRSSTEGTEGERGFALGLPLLAACVARLDGKISWSSAKSQQYPRVEGTEFTVVLPNFSSLEP